MANRVARRIVRIGRRRGVPRKHILAALATGRVESNFRNLPGGDADSQGWRQERRSIYSNPRNVRASINRFYNEAAQHDHGQSAGRLAADVQRPAAQYRGRYSEVLKTGEPQRLLRRGGRGVGTAPGGTRRSGYSIPPMLGVKLGERTVFDEAEYENAQRRSVLAQYLQKQGKGDSVLFRLGLLNPQAPDPGEFTSTALTSRFYQAAPGINIKPPSRPGGRGGEQRYGVVSGPAGKVTIAPTADRPGVRTKKPVIRFVRQIAGRTGRALQIGTGTNHSQMTVNGNVSAHWTGNAADIPLRGAALIKAGQDALISAGMNPRKARRIRGGLYNVGGWQIIFNTQEGGDHTDHLHVGRRG